MVLAVPAIRFQLFEPYQSAVDHAIFTRHGGVSQAPFDSLNVSYLVGDRSSDVARNRASCARALGLTLPAVTAAGLVHGARIGCLERSPTEALLDGSHVVRQVDALISAISGQALLVTAADCLQLLLFDPATPAVGLVHAGWRGLVAGVIDAAVEAMRLAYGSRPDAMLAGIGPGLGPCCAEFTDPTSELPRSLGPYIQGRNVDLWAVAVGQLRAAGLGTERIEHAAICTRCHRDQFFSHRGDGGHTGRFAAIIALR